MKANRKYIIFLFTLLTGGLFSCQNDNHPAENKENPKIPVVSVMHPQIREHSSIYKYNGTVKPFRQANLGTSIPGRVEKIYAKEGDLVQQGTLIARLSAEPATMAEIEMNTWKNEYDRVSRLLERGSITRQEFEQIEAQYKGAKTKHDLMRKNTEIRAPFAGTVTEILVNEGETFFFVPAMEQGASFSPGIIRLMQLNPLLVEIHIPGKEIQLPEEATKIVASLSAFPDEKFRATLHHKSSMVSQPSRTLAVEMKIDNPGNRILPGMVATITLEKEEGELLFIPTHALHKEKDDEYVWLADPETKAIRKSVTSILSHQGYVAVSGLEPSDKVILTGYTALHEGIRLEIHSENR
jgi:membrane fusion protein (multidrug efflux system)